MTGTAQEPTATSPRDPRLARVVDGVPPARDGRLDLVLGGLVFAQALLGGYRAFAYLHELPTIASPLLGKAGEPGAFSSLAVVAAVAAVGAAGALGRREGGLVARLGSAGLWGLCALAAAGVALTAAGVATTRFLPSAGWGAIGIVAAAALTRLSRRARAREGARSRTPAPENRARLSPWDAGTALLLVALAVPAVFPFVHYDAREIWGCRALAVGGSGSLQSLADCSHASYPPLFSLLMALGGPDPVLSGRLVPWLLIAFHALYLRASFARLSPSRAAAATLWVVSTGHVWVTGAMYYANTALMAFVATAALLLLGVPARRARDGSPPAGAQVAAALLLAAAVLVRPDGVVYVAIVAVVSAVLLLLERRPIAWSPFSAALAAWLLWATRPAALRAPGTFLESPSTWRTAGGTATEAAFRVIGTLLKAWQEQWLSHYGLGLTIWVLAALALVILLRRPSLDLSARAYGLVTLGSLTAVALTYAVLPFAVDMVGASELPNGAGFLPSLRHFVRTGMGRMTIHLLPLYVAFALAALPALRRSSGGSASAGMGGPLAGPV